MFEQFERRQTADQRACTNSLIGDTWTSASSIDYGQVGETAGDYLPELQIEFDESGEGIDEGDVDEVTASQDELAQLATDAITDPEDLEQFLSDMEQFEIRARAQGLTDEQIAETYRQIARLLEDNPDAVLDFDTRVNLAMQVMNQAAYPNSIDQGAHPTCTVASTEVRLYTLDPAAAVQVVADVALTGTYSYELNGHTYYVSLDPEGHDSSTSWTYERDESRSHASQIFQTVALDIHFAMESQEQGISMDYVYMPESDEDEDNDGYVVQTTENGREFEEEDFNGLYDDEIEDIYGVFSDVQEEDFVITYGDAEVEEDGTEVAPDSEDVIYVGSMEEFEAMLAAAEEEGRFPLIVLVDTTGPPFNFETDGRGGHALCIVGYDPGPPPMVEVDNQWGSGNDMLGTEAIPLSELYVAMMDPGSPEAVEFRAAQVSELRANNQLDLTVEMDYLRQLSRTASNEELSAAMNESADYIAAYWQEHPPTEEERRMMRRYFNEIAEEISDPVVRVDVMHHAYELGLVTFNDLESEMLDLSEEIIEEQEEQSESESDEESGGDEEADGPANIRRLVGQLEPTLEEMQAEFSLVYNNLTPDEQAEFVKEALERGIDVTLLGIDPIAMGIDPAEYENEDNGEDGTLPDLGNFFPADEDEGNG